jgi:uncharacterized protein DUF4032
MRFVFAPPAESTTGLLSLPWREPIETWQDDRLVEIRQRGISRHVVRFVAEGGQVYALKELDERLAMVELLARLHLAGFMWGDCSLSNTLFLLDAGALAAHLVDAETSELHDRLSDGKRAYDVDLAFERVGGELFDLQAGGLLPADVDPIAVAEEIPRRYEALWSELTREDTLLPSEQRYRIAQRLQRLNELGFDVDEVELIDAGDGSNKLRMRTRVAEPGHHRRLLFTRTGLHAQENQARRLLNDIASYRSHLERSGGRPVPLAVAANKWLSEVYDPVVRAIPEPLRDRLDPVEIFHEILEHRWFLSERAGRDIGTTAAREDYFARVLPRVPGDLTITAPRRPSADVPATPV